MRGEGGRGDSQNVCMQLKQVGRYCALVYASITPKLAMVFCTQSKNRVEVSVIIISELILTPKV